MKELFQFLENLKRHNNREWFQENKGKYLKVKKVFEEFVGNTIRGISEFDPDMTNVQVKDSVFRIYRDVRFSPDKSPYKTHMGAFMAKGGKMNPRGGYYIHIEPGNSLFSGGIWCPDAALLKNLRQDIYDNAEEFLSIVENPELTRYYVYDDEKLKKVPVPFPNDSPVSEWLKNKRFTPASYVPDDFFSDPDVVEKCVERLKLLYPLNRFLNYTIDENQKCPPYELFI